ncbi:MAG TPA: DUF2141 domain-containing protein [Gallionella sp.]|nr:DUF2141 domain-containing protein [Gallionella sp.]
MLRHKVAASLMLVMATLQSQAAELVVHVDHVANDRGFVCVAIHRTESGYLDGDDAKAFRLGKIAAHAPEVTLRFELPAGKYAIKAFHDENGDGKLNRNFFGAPTEPYGISNNVRARFSLPPFQDAQLTAGDAVTETHIGLAGH